MTAFNLAIVSWCVGANQFVPNTEPCQFSLKGSKRAITIGQQPLCKLRTIVCLHALNGIRKALYHVLEEQLGRICAVLLKGFQIAKTAVLVDESILIPSCSRLLTHNTHFRNIFHINLHSPSRILYLFVRFWNIFGIWQLHSQLIAFAQEPIQSGEIWYNRAAEVLPRTRLSRCSYSPQHIQDELRFLWCVLIWMAVRAVRVIRQRLKRSVVTFEPAVDILTVGVVADCRFCYAVFLRVAN